MDAFGVVEILFVGFGDVVVVFEDVCDGGCAGGDVDVDALRVGAAEFEGDEVFELFSVPDVFRAEFFEVAGVGVFVVYFFAVLVEAVGVDFEVFDDDGVI